VPPGLSPLAVVQLLAMRPWALIVRRWNYKAAVTSALCRGPLFFLTNLSAGLDAAEAALLTEVAFRLATSGCYGAITQAFRHARPARQATVVAMVLLPALGHSGEAVVHWLSGTSNLGTSLIASVALTCVTTTFNLFAMRRGALVVGEGSATLVDDLRRLPALVAAFLLSWRSRPSI
jgi:uncharacterized protein YuzB (UPF0349 family)